MTITGAEWKQFLAEGWPAGCVFADGSTLSDERDIFDDGAELRIPDHEAFEIPTWWRAWRERVAAGPGGHQSGALGEGAWVVDLVAGWHEGWSPEDLLVPMARTLSRATPRYGVVRTPDTAQHAQSADMTITGAEWKQFLAEGWPAGCVFEEETTLDDGRALYTEDGSLCIGDGETFEVPDWWRVMREDPATGHLRTEDRAVRDLVESWRANRSHEIVVLRVPKDEGEWARTIAQEQGWELLNRPEGEAPDRPGQPFCRPRARL